MPKDALTSAILNAVQLPHGNWQESRSQAVFALLLGAAASLITCRKFVARYNPDMPSRWDDDVAQLFGDFTKAANKSGTLRWDASDHLFVWSMGFFLNRAQQNIAAALDVCVNTWLAWRLQMDFKKIVGDEENVFYDPIATRLRILMTLVPDEAVKVQLDELKCSFSKYMDTDKAKKCIKDLGGGLKQRSSWSSLSHLYSKLKIMETDCTAVIFGRVNAFKHRVMGYRLDRSGIDHLVEWVVTARALVRVGAFWHAMVNDWNTLRKLQHHKSKSLSARRKG